MSRLQKRETLRQRLLTIIQHQGEEYRLRITRHDKLILTK